jgi:hypothetical protein
VDSLWIKQQRRNLFVPLWLISQIPTAYCGVRTPACRVDTRVDACPRSDVPDSTSGTVGYGTKCQKAFPARLLMMSFAQRDWCSAQEIVVSGVRGPSGTPLTANICGVVG